MKYKLCKLRTYEKGNRGLYFYLNNIAGFANPSYMEFVKEMRSFRGKEFTKLMIIYNYELISGDCLEDGVV